MYPRRRHSLFPRDPTRTRRLPANFARDFPQIKVERGVADKYLIPWDKTNWGPRIGIAYQIFTRTVVRGGYGLFYGGEENQGGSPNRGEGVPVQSNDGPEPE